MEEIKISQSLAQRMYDKQLKDITNICHTEWYKEIKWFWERVRDWAWVELETVLEENLKTVQMKKQIANDFIMFLNNLESAKVVRNKTQDL